MENKVDSILRSSNLEDIIKRLDRILEKKGFELGKMQRECKHEVVVFTEEEKCYSGYDDNLYRKCLFCGVESESRRSFGDSSMVIDVSNFQNGNLLDRTIKYDIVKSLYLKIANSNPGYSIEEIVSAVNEELDSQNK